MFDGSHRQRRTIDLSGRPRRRATTSSKNSKAALLESARIHREARRLEQRRLESAKRIQRVWRGCHCRRGLVHQWSSNDNLKSLSLTARILSPPLVVFLHQSQILSLLLTAQIHTHQTKDTSATQKRLLAGRVSRYALKYLLQSEKKNQKLSEENKTVLLNLVWNLLTEGNNNNNNNNNNNIVSLLRCKHPLEKDDGLILLFLCFKEHYLRSNSHQILLDLSCRAALELQGTNDLGLSILASILFCHQTLLTSEQDELDSCLAQHFCKNTQDSSNHQNYGHYTLLLQSIVKVITSNDDDDENEDEAKDISVGLSVNTDLVTIPKIVKEIISGREWFLLLNAIKLNESSRKELQTLNHLCIQLIQYTFTNCQYLRILSALVAQGQNIQTLFTGEKRDQTTDMMDVDDDGTDDEGIEGEEIESRSLPARNQIQRRNYLKRLTRQDVQTVNKLNRLYRNNLQSSQQYALNQLKSELDKPLILSLVEKLGNGDLMQKMGLSIFSNSSGKNVHPTSSKIKESYCVILQHLLQFCTGIQTKQNALSPFMSKLGFSYPILENIWDQAKQLASEDPDYRKPWKKSSVAAMIVFCDLFSHHLLAVDDNEFLNNFTEIKQGHNIRVNAEHVVVCLRSILYSLYWAKPVLIDDVNSDNDKERYIRARLMLSGSKLWNSLYERWSRLFRSTPFCSEDCWWFPTLITKDQDEGAVSNEFERSMDVFNDGDTSPMDIEGQIMTDDDESVEMTPSQTNTVEDENEALASSFRDPKMARILTFIPQSLPFDRRVKLFNSLLNADKLHFQDEASSLRRQMMDFHSSNGIHPRGVDFSEMREKVEIHRGALFDDSMEKLNPLGKKLRKRVQVTFINQHGAHEAGIDGGGVFKEFLDDLIKEAFHPETISQPTNGDLSRIDGNSFFVESPVQTLAVNVNQPNPSSSLLEKYEFLGRVLGKAVYEGILVEPQFCLPFLNQLLGKQNTLDDLKNLDPEYYKHLTSLRYMNKSEIQNLTLFFELFYKSGKNLSHLESIELIPNGSSIAVTKENVVRYIHLVAHRRLNVESSLQTRAFLRGFRDLIPAAWVRIFSSYELQKLIGGDDTIKGIDVNGMKSAMQYSGGYHPSQSIIHFFWEVIEEMTAIQQRKFLKFMTSCSRQPLLGFKALVPLPCIQQIRLSENQFIDDIPTGEVRLPTSSTCMNLLKLPNYKSKKILKEKLLYAIESGSGFELT